MRVFLTIWISAVLIQEVIPGTLVRLPRHTPKRPALVQTEFEGKYEQKGQNGTENSGLFSGKHHIVHHDCGENWNDFADKCATLVKDLVASLANTVSSRPGDATKLQLQIKNTFKHFDSTHNLTCLNDATKSSSKLDLSCLFDNITISTVTPTMNINTTSTGANNEKEGRKCRKGVVGPVSNGDEDDGNGCSEDRDNNIDPQYSHPAGVSRKPNTAIAHATNPDLNPENDEDPDTGSNSRRQAEYPQVSWQPGNKTGHSHINQGRSNSISRSPYPFIVTPQPNSAYGSPVPASYSDGNNLPYSNTSPADASGQSGTPLKSQAFPTTIAYHPEPASDSHYKTAVPDIGNHNSAYPTVTGVPSALDDHHDPVLVPTGPDGHSSTDGYTLPKAPVTEESYDPNSVPVKPMTDKLSNTQPGTIPSTEPRDPKFPQKNSPESRHWTKEPERALSTSTDQTAALPSTKPVLTTGKPEGFSTPTDKKLGVPVINSDSNIPENQMGTTNLLPTDRNSNPPSAAFINHEPEHTTFSPTTNKFSDTVTPPSEHVPPSVHVEPTLPEADNHKSEGPSDPGHILNNPSEQSAPGTIKPSFLSPNLDHLGGSSSENVDGKPKRGAPVTVHSVLMSTTMSPLGYNTDEKPEGNSGSKGNDNSGKSTTYQEDDCEDDDAEDTGKTPATTPQPSGHSLQGTGKPQSNVEGNSTDKNGIGQSPASGSGSHSNTDPDSEDYEDCDESTHSDSATSRGTGNHATTAVVPPVHAVPKKSDPMSKGSAPVSGDDGKHTGSSNDPNSMPHYSSNTGTANDATTPITASPTQSVPHHTVEVQGHEPATDDYEDCDEHTESSNHVTTPVAVSSVKPATKKSDSVRESAPVSDDGESTGTSTIPNSVPHSNSNTAIAKDVTTPVTAFPRHSHSTVPDPIEHGDATAPEDYEDCDEDTESSNGATTPVPVTPVKHVPNPAVPVTSSNTGTFNHATSPVPVPSVKPVPQVPDTAVQGNAPASDGGGENTGSSSYPNSASHFTSDTEATDYPNSVSVTSSNTGTINHPTTSDPVHSVKPVQSDPAVGGSVPASDGGSESTGSSSHPNSASHLTSGTGATDYPNSVSVTSSNTGTTNHATTSVPVPSVKHIQSDPVLGGSVPASDGGSESTGSSSHPNSASHFTSSTVATDYPNTVSHGSSNDATTPVPESVKPFSTLSDPAGQSQQSGDSPTSKTKPGVDGDPNNNQSTPLNVTPTPHIYSSFSHTTISTSTEGQSHDPENEDSPLYKPTTFQTTATNPTSPQSILLPTESTKGLTKAPTPSHSSAGDDDDDDDEDCCSCESCTEEITDPKQYKENACKNLEEARKELKAIFDKIKKKLKCGRKACGHTIGQISSG